MIDPLFSSGHESVSSMLRSLTSPGSRNEMEACVVERCVSKIKYWMPTGRQAPFRDLLVGSKGLELDQDIAKRVSSVHGLLAVLTWPKDDTIRDQFSNALFV